MNSTTLEKSELCCPLPSRCDKSRWADGPWIDEPDQDLWYDESTGYLCQIRRHPDHGNLCGYVRVPEDHIFYGKSYDDRTEGLRSQVDLTKAGVIDLFAEAFSKEADGTIPITLAVSVHWGLTFAGERGPGDGWWFGFDCAHAGDMIQVPRADSFFPSLLSKGEYRDWDYVVKEVTSLAHQLERLK